MSSTRFWTALALTCACITPALAQPANDDCATATVAVDGVNAVDNTGSVGTTVLPTGCVNSPGDMANDVWLSYTAMSDGLLDIITCDATGFDTDLAIYDGGCMALNQLACDGDGGTAAGCQDFDSAVSLTAIMGTTYLIQIGGFDSTEVGANNVTITLTPLSAEICNDGIDNDGDGDIDCADGDCAADMSCLPPANDNCADAISIMDGVTTTWSTDNATNETALACRGTSDIWYEWTSTGTGLLDVALSNVSPAPNSVSTTSTDTNFSVYVNPGAGACPTDMDEIACIDPFTTSGLGVSPGVSYLIRIGSWTTTAGTTFTGDLDLTFTMTAAEICDDGIDNDGDGFTDCADDDCIMDPNCALGLCGTPDTILADTTVPVDLTTQPISGISCNGNGQGPDRFYSFTADFTFDYTITLTGSDFDGEIAVHDLGAGDPCAGDAVCLDRVDSGGTGTDEVLTVGLSAGVNYLIQVGTWGPSAAPGSMGSLTVAGPPIGPNGTDECAVAPVIAEGIFAFDSTMAADTMMPATSNTPACATINSEIWYLYTATLTATTQVSTCNLVDFDSEITVFDPTIDDPCLGGDSCIVSNDDNSGAGCTGNTSLLLFEAVAGQQYYIAIGGFSGTSTAFNGGTGFVEIQQFTNDSCEFATQVFAGTTPWDNTGQSTSSVEPDDTQCDFGFGSQAVANDLFYVYTAVVDGDVTATLENTTFDTRFAVYDLSLGDPCADTATAGICVGACDDCGAGGPEFVTWSATTGSSYLIQLGGFSGSGTGDLVIVEPVSATINEIRLDQVSAPDRDEFIELVADPGTDLSTLTYIVIGDDASEMGNGFIENVIPLTGLIVPASGFAVVAGAGFSLGSADLQPGPDLTLNLEDADNVTHLLVSGFTGLLGDDLDTNDDGVLDIEPWDNIIDEVAIIADDVMGDLTYSSESVGPFMGGAPASVQRCLTSFDPFFAIAIGDSARNTPGDANDCIPAGDDCTNPIIVTPAPLDAMLVSSTSIAFDNRFATTDSIALDAMPCSFEFSDQQNSNELWYSYTADCTGDLLVSICDDFVGDSQLAIYNASTGDPCLGESCIIANDDTCGLGSELTAPIVSGETYLIALGSFDEGAVISGTLLLECQQQATAPVAAGALDQTGPAITDYTVTLTDSSDDGLDTAATISVAWGDGAMDSGVPGDVLSHTYTTAGSFDVMLTVTNIVGSDTISVGTVETFLNGDCSGDGSFSLDDVLALLGVLFQGDAAPACSNNCDTDGNGVLSIADAIASLSALFQGGSAPANAGQDCN